MLEGYFGIMLGAGQKRELEAWLLSRRVVRRSDGGAIRCATKTMYLKLLMKCNEGEFLLCCPAIGHF